MYTTYHQVQLCPGYAPGAGHSALTQQNVHSWGKYCHCTQHIIGSTNEGVIEHAHSEGVIEHVV